MPYPYEYLKAGPTEALADAVLDRVPDLQRIAICGCSGSGKSTLSMALSRRAGLPHISIDALYWRPGWVETPRDVFDAALGLETAKANWVMDGNFISALGDRFSRADAIIIFDLPTALCLSRAFRRIVGSYGKVRPEMAPGCPERFDWEFFSYIATFRRKKLPDLLHAIETHAACPVIRIVR